MVKRYKCRRCRSIVTNYLWIPATLTFLPLERPKPSHQRLPRAGAKPIVWKVCPRCLPVVLAAIGDDADLRRAGAEGQ